MFDRLSFSYEVLLFFLLFDALSEDVTQFPSVLFRFTSSEGFFSRNSLLERLLWPALTKLHNGTSIEAASERGFLLEK